VVTYPDTSFLVSLYIQEGTTVRAKSHMAAQMTSLPFTPFHRLELRTAFRLRAFQGLLDPADLQSALRQSEEDLAAKILEHTPLNWSKALREAERIGAEHLAEVGARSGDLLHVASAVVLGATDFLTFDQRQVALAKRVGLKVKHWPGH
jgi:hypothetical protein